MLAPAIVSVDVPAGVFFGSVVTVNVAVPGAFTVAGVKVAVAPGGRPDAVRVTGPVNPPWTLIVRGKLAVAPGLMVTD